MHFFLKGKDKYNSFSFVLSNEIYKSIFQAMSCFCNHLENVLKCNLKIGVNYIDARRDAMYIILYVKSFKNFNKL